MFWIEKLIEYSNKKEKTVINLAKIEIIKRNILSIKNKTNRIIPFELLDEYVYWIIKKIELEFQSLTRRLSQLEQFKLEILNYNIEKVKKGENDFIESEYIESYIHYKGLLFEATVKNNTLRIYALSYNLQQIALKKYKFIDLEDWDKLIEEKSKKTKRL